MQSILFLCVANSARSQMAEGLAREMFDSGVQVQSAGSEPSQVNPWAIEVMDEIGIDIRNQESTDVQEVDPREVDVVITLCADEVCPAFLGEARRYDWPLEDPDTDEDLDDDEMLERFRAARDAIERRLENLSD